MIKNKTTIEYISNNRVIQIICDTDTPIDIVKEALAKFLQYVGNIEDNAKNQLAKIEEEKILTDDSPLEG